MGHMFEWIRKNKRWVLGTVGLTGLVGIAGWVKGGSVRQAKNRGANPPLGIRNRVPTPGQMLMAATRPQRATEFSNRLQTTGGEVLADLSYADAKIRLAEKRERIMEKIWDRAQEMISQGGIAAAALPVKVVVPLLQNASLEEDEYLRERWASMLANAANPRSGMHAAFPEILRQLTAEEVRFSEALFDIAEQRLMDSVTHQSPQQGRNPARDLGGSSDLHELFCTVIRSDSAGENGYQFAVALENLRRCQIIEGPIPGNPQISFTAFGIEFRVFQWHLAAFLRPCPGLLNCQSDFSRFGFGADAEVKYGNLAIGDRLVAAGEKAGVDVFSRLLPLTFERFARSRGRAAGHRVAFQVH